MQTRPPPPSVDELSAWLRLSQEPGLGAAQARHLLAAAGLPQQIYATAISALRQWLPEPLAQQLRSPPDAALQKRIDDALAWLAEPGHHLLTLADAAYPPRLLELHDPPLVLYVNGDPALLGQPAISIVGARTPTAAGLDNARAFATHLARQGWHIISGLAQGIDTAAHRGALLAGPDAGQTIAVLGTGIDIVYPAANRELAHQVAAQGALVSEFPMGCRAMPYQFPQRNRLVAALGQGVLVVEAARQSGSLITARHATDIGREVFAIPGSIHSPLSRGCHALIRQGAKLVESAQDILEELGGAGAILPPGGSRTRHAPRQKAAPPAIDTTPGSNTASGNSLDPVSAVILAALGYDPVDLDTLETRTGLAVAALSARLSALELDDIVQRMPDGRFHRSIPA